MDALARRAHPANHASEGPAVTPHTAGDRQPSGPPDAESGAVALRAGIMPLYTPLGGSWLNMAESIQRILKQRALEGHHPQTPEEIIDWHGSSSVRLERGPNAVRAGRATCSPSPPESGAASCPGGSYGFTCRPTRRPRTTLDQ